MGREGKERKGKERKGKERTQKKRKMDVSAKVTSG